MFMWAINKTLEGAMKTAWKPVRSFFDGASGTKKFLNEAGEEVKLNPAQKLARRLKNDGEQFFTGNRRNLKGELIEEDLNAFDRHVTNRIGGALHFIGDATVGTVMTGLGWGARTMTGAGLWAGKKAIKPTALGVGHVTKQTMGLVGDTALGGAELISEMGKTTAGRNTLGIGGLLGAGAIGTMGAANDKWGESGVRIAMKNMYDGNALEAVPGTIGPTQSVQRNPLDDMGADGDLVFAMHNMR